MLTDSYFLIVEDEFLIAETISEILTDAGCKNIQMVASVEDAVKEIELHKPDMVLTDINLGKDKTGIDLGNLLNTVYRIPFIYITSHSSAEILHKAKYTRPNAYIVKPFKNADLLVAIELALFNSTSNETEQGDELVLKEGRAMVRINCNDIKWFETEGNYTTIYLEGDKRRVVRISLSELQEQISAKQFIRIHKSYIINKKFVTEVRSGNVMIDANEFPIGRTYQQDVIDFFK